MFATQFPKGVLLSLPLLMSPLTSWPQVDTKHTHKRQSTSLVSTYLLHPRLNDHSESKTSHIHTSKCSCTHNVLGLNQAAKRIQLERGLYRVNWTSLGSPFVLGCYREVCEWKTQIKTAYVTETQRNTHATIFEGQNATNWLLIWLKRMPVYQLLSPNPEQHRGNYSNRCFVWVCVCVWVNCRPCSAFPFCFRVTIAAERESHYGVYLSDDSKHIHPFSFTPFDNADYANSFFVDFVEYLCLFTLQ